MEAYNHLSICREQACNKVGQVLPFCLMEQPALSISDFGYCVLDSENKSSYVATFQK